MTIRFTAKTIEKLCDMVRGQVDDVRKKERELRRIIVDKCGMPQDNFIADFSAATSRQQGADQLLNLKWIEKQAAAGKPWSAVHGPQHPAGAGTAAKADRPADRAWWCRWTS